MMGPDDAVRRHKSLNLPLQVGGYFIYKTPGDPTGWYNNGNLYIRRTAFGWHWECHALHHSNPRSGWSWSHEGAIRRYYQHAEDIDDDE
jgi:hypothetical protein